jgi:phospholipid-binding lipoprotein MlaA
MAPTGYQQLAPSDRSAARESASEPIFGCGRAVLGFRPLAGIARSALVLVAALALLGGSYAAAEPTGVAPDDSPPPAEAEYDPLFDDEKPDPLFDDDFDFDIEETRSGFPDPLERMNRGTLAFNGVVDRWVLDPITIAYRFILPEKVRRAITRALFNINSTQVLVNDIFQLEWTDAGITLSRLVINSTAGIGGLFDPAANMGLERHVSDFGQTLAISGAPSGMYFMLPLLGPTTVRDGVGLGVDAFFHPTFYLLGGTDVLLFSGSSGLTERARHFEELKALEESSVDFYAAMRSGYYQNRVSEIWSRREDRRPDNHE